MGSPQTKRPRRWKEHNCNDHITHSTSFQGVKYKSGYKGHNKLKENGGSISQKKQHNNIRATSKIINSTHSNKEVDFVSLVARLSDDRDANSLGDDGSDCSDVADVANAPPNALEVLDCESETHIVSEKTELQ